MSELLHRLPEYFAEVDISALNLDLERLPSHIAVIMDGNGRWAKARGLARSQGHIAGVNALRELIESCVHLKIKVLTCYAFSTENWKRPQVEVQLLMRLFAETLSREMPSLMEKEVRLRFIGDLEKLPDSVRQAFAEGVEATKNNKGLTLCLAVNYGGRDEIVRAVGKLIEDFEDHKVSDPALSPADYLSEERISSMLDTAPLPDPELIIRSSGELRISNFLLWQIAYAEIYVTESFWPDFNRQSLLEAISAYQNRSRRFGGIS